MVPEIFSIYLPQINCKRSEIGDINTCVTLFRKQSHTETVFCDLFINKMKEETKSSLQMRNTFDNPRNFKATALIAVIIASTHPATLHTLTHPRPVCLRNIVVN